ncbi:hypothetical protein G7066_01210 [Leucobacter coleopterorum]|uniref:Uncharacterized protein n=1 Tax=Leucobacter coleopterorum TaxID=2714933 RepID=A0ABX6JTQ4_9MICO|nr:hypothetical protein [Leucobacter coleopterorum]QIM17665.1 hypothetical protein G7066_01210 [Leucobacter coleopterorum]
MEMIAHGTIYEASEQRANALLGFREQGETLAAEASAIAESLSEAFGTPAPAVKAEFAPDGRPFRLVVDETLRARLTEDQLCVQIAFALAAGPYPASVVSVAKVLEKDLDSIEISDTVVFATPDRALKLTARFGKTISIEARNGFLLWLSPQEISEKILRLAVQAWEQVCGGQV